MKHKKKKIYLWLSILLVIIGGYYYWYTHPTKERIEQRLIERCSKNHYDGKDEDVIRDVREACSCVVYAHSAFLNEEILLGMLNGEDENKQQKRIAWLHANVNPFRYVQAINSCCDSLSEEQEMNLAIGNPLLKKCLSEKVSRYDLKRYANEKVRREYCLEKKTEGMEELFESYGFLMKMADAFKACEKEFKKNLGIEEDNANDKNEDVRKRWHIPEENK